jgi:TolB-like protein
MSKDDTGTLAALKACEAELIEPTVSKHNGRIFKRMGDGYLVEFASAVDVVECALAWQDQLLAKENQPLTFRIGINLGEVIAEADDVYGDGVNIAARLESLAQPGCIALSDDAFRQVRDRLDVKFHDLGDQEVKNIPQPVHVWEWQCKRALPRRLQNSKLPQPKKPSIVLLPFRNLSGDEQQDFLAEGLRIDIQNALTKVSGVFLIAAGAANALRGVTPEDASAGVGVQYVLQGSVRTAGKRVRVAVELTDAAADEVVWAEQFDRTLNDSFELQDEITARVLMAMNVKLVAGEQAKVWHKTLKDLKALEIFYKGLDAFFKMEQDEMVRARQHFETVAKMHPEVSTGATWVALTHWFDIQRGWAQSPETSRDLAGQFAETAAAMEDTDGQAHTVLSHVHLMNRNYDEALAAGRGAIANRPGCANANGFYANVLHYCGEHDEAIRHINLAMRYQPLHPPFFKNILSAAYLAKNELVSAISTAKQTIELAPADILARLILTSAYVRSDRQDLAKETVAEIENLDPSFSVTRFADTQYYRSAEFVEQFSAELRSAGLSD